MVLSTKHALKPCHGSKKIRNTVPHQFCLSLEKCASYASPGESHEVAAVSKIFSDGYSKSTKSCNKGQVYAKSDFFVAVVGIIYLRVMFI